MKTFLEHLAQWKDPQGMLMFGGSIALIIVSLVIVDRYRKDRE